MYAVLDFSKQKKKKKGEEDVEEEGKSEII
jgi:hypothetical protein